MFGWLLFLLTTVASVFWFNEWKFHLPTTIPKGYTAVYNGTKIELNDSILNHQHRPLLVHFFNPSCPCSRFNINVFAGLVQKYHLRVDFAVVLVTGNDLYNDADFESRYGLHVRILHDQTLAQRCGVYSTPQAVVLDKNHRLYYRGNYNSSRYCVNEATSFARIALDSVVNQVPAPSFDIAATRSYGCSLLSCSKPSKP
jgi:thioredoxin-related protein